MNAPARPARRRFSWTARLAPDVRMGLENLLANKVQLCTSIDGPEEIHDRRRPLAGGRGTFRTILTNVVAAADILPIRIRVNIGITPRTHANDDVTLLLNIELSSLGPPGFEGLPTFGKRNVTGGSQGDGPLIRVTGSSAFSKVIVTRGKDDWNLH